LELVAFSNIGALGDEEQINTSLDAGLYYIRVYPFHKGPDSSKSYYSLRVSSALVSARLRSEL